MHDDEDGEAARYGAVLARSAGLIAMTVCVGMIASSYHPP